MKPLQVGYMDDGQAVLIIYFDKDSESYEELKYLADNLNGHKVAIMAADTTDKTPTMMILGRNYVTMEYENPAK